MLNICFILSLSLGCTQRLGYMRLGVVSDQLWIYQLESMVVGNTKPSICCGCHGWRIIALLAVVVISRFYLHYSIL